MFRGYRMPPTGFAAMFTESKLVSDQWLSNREVLYCFVKVSPPESISILLIRSSTGRHLELCSFDKALRIPWGREGAPSDPETFPPASHCLSL
eukprot:184276-Prorocentrum_minimum.AAC.1